jgi:hypothetical protein
MHFSPPLLYPLIKKFFGGWELFGEPSREITSEAAAAHLRHSASQLPAFADNYSALGTIGPSEDPRCLANVKAIGREICVGLGMSDTFTSKKQIIVTK